ncbi:hypothetical protein [Micromonospora matsumotoense]|uniref:hypothetical protein n=1 Tax=Micromonospora matsumotoense TaxID=121616 RepID=UPI0033D342B7
MALALRFSTDPENYAIVFQYIELPLEVEQAMTTEELDTYIETEFKKKYVRTSGRPATDILEVIYMNRQERPNYMVRYSVYGIADQTDHPEPPPPGDE